jgi:hypothetical protein
MIDTYRQALIPWVWCRGGRRAEDEILRILERGFKSASREWSSGTIALMEIKIPVPERLDEPVACDPLIAQVTQSFASFTAQEVRAIVTVAGNRGDG